MINFFTIVLTLVYSKNCIEDTRIRKSEVDRGGATNETTSGSDDDNGSSGINKIHINKLNQQPISKTVKGFDPNR